MWISKKFYKKIMEELYQSKTLYHQHSIDLYKAAVDISNSKAELGFVNSIAENLKKENDALKLQEKELQGRLEDAYTESRLRWEKQHCFLDGSIPSVDVLGHRIKSCKEKEDINSLKEDCERQYLKQSNINSENYMRRVASSLLMGTLKTRASVLAEDCASKKGVMVDKIRHLEIVVSKISGECLDLYKENECLSKELKSRNEVCESLARRLGQCINVSKSQKCNEEEQKANSKGSRTK